MARVDGDFEREALDREPVFVREDAAAREPLVVVRFALALAPCFVFLGAMYLGVLWAGRR